jgi:hypothetical protein
MFIAGREPAIPKCRPVWRGAALEPIDDDHICGDAASLTCMASTAYDSIHAALLEKWCCAGPTSAAHGGSGHEQVTLRLHRLFVWDRRGNRSSA